MSCAASLSVMMPLAPSMAAWAMEPVISSLYMRLSKEMEELKSSASFAVSCSYLPAHSLFISNPFLTGPLAYDGAKRLVL